jgi:hypothetical protein
MGFSHLRGRSYNRTVVQYSPRRQRRASHKLRPRPIDPRMRARKSTDTLAAADLDLPDDAKVALDDLTQEYRWGDAAR